MRIDVAAVARMAESGHDGLGRVMEAVAGMPCATVTNGARIVRGTAVWATEISPRYGARQVAVTCPDGWTFADWVEIDDATVLPWDVLAILAVAALQAYGDASDEPERVAGSVVTMARDYWESVRAAREDVQYVRCAACGEPSDCCRGHGEIGDPDGLAIIDEHDDGHHARCHRGGCADAHRAAYWAWDPERSDMFCRACGTTSDYCRSREMA